MEGRGPLIPRAPVQLLQSFVTPLPCPEVPRGPPADSSACWGGKPGLLLPLEHTDVCFTEHEYTQCMLLPGHPFPSKHPLQQEGAVQSLANTPNTRKRPQKRPVLLQHLPGSPCSSRGTAALGAAVWWQPPFDCSQQHAGTRLEVCGSKHSFPRADLIIYI